MALHPNVARATRAEEVRERGTFEPEDMAVLEDYLDENVVWHGRDNWPDTVGRDNVIGQMKGFKAATGGTLKLHMGDIYADAKHAVVICRLTAERNGKSMDVTEVNLFHFNDAGKVTEFWGIALDGGVAQDAFWSA
jgi:ketosteroid isomerase-like protein